MKRILIACLLCCQLSAHSQRIVTTYYDSLWRLTTKPNASFYRVGIVDTVNYHYYGEVKDFYSNATLQMKGRYYDNAKIDTFYFYHANGNLQMKGRYYNGVRNGVWTSYYNTGQVRDRVLYHNGTFVTAVEHYDATGKATMLKGTGTWTCDRVTNEEGDRLQAEGIFKDSLRHGEWKYFATPGRVADGDATEIFALNVFKGGTEQWNGRPFPHSSALMTVLPELTKFKAIESWETTPYANLKSYPKLRFLPPLDSTAIKDFEDFSRTPDKVAQFPGGEKALTKFIAKNFKAPKPGGGSPQFTIIEFVIGRDGVIDQKSIKPVGGGYSPRDEEGVRVIGMMPPWQPAQYKGKAVKQKLGLPFRIAAR